jgi:four helix bundle protein
MSRGSLTETQSHLEYGRRVGYINNTNAENLDRDLAELYNDINKVILRLKGTKK